MMKWIIALLFFIQSAEAQDWSVGYIANSYHFERSDDKNETHNGVYVKYGYGLIGAYKNTHHKDSVFVGAEYPLTTYRNIDVSASLFIANNYDDHELSRNGYLLIPSINTKYSVFWISVNPKAALFGLEFTLR